MARFLTPLAIVIITVALATPATATVGGALAAAPAPPTQVAPVCGVHAEVTGPCPGWVSVYDVPDRASQPDRISEMVSSVDGSRTFVTGATWDDDDEAFDLTTLALDSASGEVIWAATFGGPKDDRPAAIALTPDGSTLIVAGARDYDVPRGVPVGRAIVLAYDVATGEERWRASHGVVANADGTTQWSEAKAAAIHPDGSTVFVTASSGPTSLVTDVVTFALDTATGEELWASRFSGPTEEEDPPGQFSVVDLDSAAGITVSPSGDRVFVTGSSSTASNQSSYLLLAYDAAPARPDGDLLWATFDDWGTTTANLGSFVAASLDGAQVYVLGEHDNATQPHVGPLCCAQHSSFGLSAYDAVTGRRLWGSTHRGPHGGITTPQALAVGPSGQAIYAAGRTIGPGPLRSQALVVAFDAMTGDVRWDATHSVPGAVYSTWSDIEATADGTRVYATGHGLTVNRASMNTVGYDTATGAQRWLATYTGDPSTEPTLFPSAMQVLPDGGVIVGGSLVRAPGAEDAGDYITLRYDAG